MSTKLWALPTPSSTLGSIWPKKLDPDELHSASLLLHSCEMPKPISSERSWELGRNRVVVMSQLSQTAPHQVGREGGPTTEGVLPLFLWCDHYKDEATAQTSFLKFV